MVWYFTVTDSYTGVFNTKLGLKNKQTMLKKNTTEIWHINFHSLRFFFFDKTIMKYQSYRFTDLKQMMWNGKWKIHKQSSLDCITSKTYCHSVFIFFIVCIRPKVLRLKFHYSTAVRFSFSFSINRNSRQHRHLDILSGYYGIIRFICYFYKTAYNANNAKRRKFSHYFSLLQKLHQQVSLPHYRVSSFFMGEKNLLFGKWRDNESLRRKPAGWD